MRILSKNRKSDLETAFQIVNNSSNSTAYQAHFERIKQSYNFVDGKQWLDVDLKELALRNQRSVTINIAAAMINNLLGQEIQSRHAVEVASDYNDPDHVRLAAALSHILYGIREVNSIDHYNGLIFQDMAICGMGVPRVYKANGVYRFSRIHPLLFCPDLNDSSRMFSHMEYCWTKHFISPREVKKYWPNADIEINLDNEGVNEQLWSSEFMAHQNPYLDFNRVGDRILVIELQRKILANAYVGFDQNGRQFKTFDEDVAQEISHSKSDIDEVECFQIKRTLIAGQNTLLETGFLKPNIPIDKNDPVFTGFEYLPACWAREDSSGLTKGVVWDSMDIFRDLNARVTKSLHLLNSKKIIIAAGSETISGLNQENLSRQIKKDDGLIMLPVNKDQYEYIENVQLGKEHLVWIREYYDLAQKQSGLYNELFGEQSNANSGIAMDMRKQSSMKNNLFAFEIFAENKKRIFTHYLHSITSSYDRNIMMSLPNDEWKEQIILNLEHPSRKGEIFNNIDNFPVYLYLKDEANFKSSFEQTQAKIEAFFQNPASMVLVHSPKLMEQMGFKDGEEISQEVLQGLQMKAMAEQGMLPPANGAANGQPPPPDQTMGQM